MSVPAQKVKRFVCRPWEKNDIIQRVNLAPGTNTQHIEGKHHKGGKAKQRKERE